MGLLAKQYRGVAVLKADVGSWESKLAEQFHIRSLPSFMVYDDKGKLVLEGDAARDFVARAVQDAQ